MKVVELENENYKCYLTWHMLTDFNTFVFFVENKNTGINYSYGPLAELDGDERELFRDCVLKLIPMAVAFKDIVTETQKRQEWVERF